MPMSLKYLWKAMTMVYIGMILAFAEIFLLQPLRVGTVPSAQRLPLRVETVSLAQRLPLRVERVSPVQRLPLRVETVSPVTEPTLRVRMPR